MFKVFYKTPLCYLSLHSDGEVLSRIHFCKNEEKAKTCALLDLALNELDLYFIHRLKKFSIPILLQGSDFEVKVYKALMQIPYGQLVSYREIAENIHHPKAFRAVGNANSKNPIPIFIPCHRVVSSKSIGGYNGGVSMKRFLLKNEGIDLK